MEAEHHRDPGTFKGGYVRSLEGIYSILYVYIIYIYMHGLLLGK